MGQQVDYDKIAAQHGGKPVDYDAIAAEVLAAPSAPAESASQGFHPVVDVLKGAGAGLLSTAYHGGDIIRRVLGMDRVINTPEAQAAMTPPDSTAGSVGFYGEQIGEFFAPAMAVSKAVKGSGLLTKMAAEGAAGATIAGIQSGADPFATGLGAGLGAILPPAGRLVGAAAKTAQRAAAGAREGGIGGAVAGAIRTVAPSAPKSMMTQAIKPRATNTRFTDSLDLSLPELKVTEQALGKPIESVDDLLKAIPIAKRRVRALFDQMAGPAKAMGTTVDLTPVGEAMARSIPKRTALQSPEGARALLSKADVYRQRFSLEDAEQLLRETNAELDSYYAKYPTAQRRALASDPVVAALDAEAKTLRDVIYRTLDDPGQGAAAREVNRRYGALLRLEEETWRRANVAARQQPESLSEQIGAVRAAGEVARGTWKVLHGDVTGAADIASGAAMRSAGKFIKEQQTTDALIRRAFALVKDVPSKIDIPPQPTIRGLLNRGPIPQGPVPDASGVSASRAPVMDYDATGRPIYSSDPAAQTVPPRPIDATFAPETPPQAPRGPAPDYIDPEFSEVPPAQLGAGTRALGPGPDLPPAAPPVAPPPTGPRTLGSGPVPRGLLGQPPEPSPAPVVAEAPAPVAPRANLTPEQQQQVEMLRQTFPYRIIYTAKSPSGEFAASAVTDMRIPNKLAREGWEVEVSGSGVTKKNVKPVVMKAPRPKTPTRGVEPTPDAPAPAQAAVTAPDADRLLGYARRADERWRKDTLAGASDYAGQFGRDEARAAATLAEAEKAKPAQTTVQPVAEAKPQTPQAAAADVRQEVARVVDLKGATSGAHVRSRVIAALADELSKAKAAWTKGDIEIIPGKAYGGREARIAVNGEQIAEMDRYGTIRARYASEDAAVEAFGFQPAKREGARSYLDIPGARNMTPAEMHKAARATLLERFQRGAQNVTVQIPGDGTFTIKRTPQALEEVIRRITKSDVSAWKGLAEPATTPRKRTR